MRRSHLIAVASLGALSVALIVVSASMFFERPSVLRVAVSSHDGDDLDLVSAAAKLAKHERKGLRIKVVPTDGVSAASHALETDLADVAVVRPDIAMPDKGETVVLLHKDVAVMVAPGGGTVTGVGDLPGKAVGLLDGRTGDGKILDTLLTQYDLAADAVRVVPLKPEEVGDAVRARRIDVLFAVGQVSSPAMQTAVRAVAKAGEGPPVFLPVAEAAAVAERLPAYEAVEVVKGSFGGTPPRPADDVDTLGVTTRLVASADLSETTVAALTRFLLSERVALADLAPVARRMTAPPTDKGAVLPVHPGTAAYIDDEEETFLDRYSDFIYIGAMVLGVFASGATALVGRIGSSGAVPIESVIERLLGLLRQVRGASGPGVLDACEAEVDTIVTEVLDRTALRSLDERKAAALTMAIDQVRNAIHDRRDLLHRDGWRPANDDPAPPAFEPILVSRKGFGD